MNAAWKSTLLAPLALSSAALLCAPAAQAGGKIQIGPQQWVSVGAGFQGQWTRVRVDQAFPGSTAGPPGLANPASLSLIGEGFGWGFTAGITLTPTPWTSIGLGYRSISMPASSRRRTWCGCAISRTRCAKAT